jgi:hypothetical protein
LFIPKLGCKKNQSLFTQLTLYQVNQRRFTKKLWTIQYLADDIIRKVDKNGILHIDGRNAQLSKSIKNQLVALRPSQDHKKLHIFFCQQKMKSIVHPNRPIKQGRTVDRQSR